MAHWQVLAGDGAPDVELTAARDRKVTFRLAEPSTLDFTIDGRHPQAGNLHELVTDVHLVRDRQVLYTGRVGGTKDKITGGAHTVDVATADYRALLGRATWHASPATNTFDASVMVAAYIEQVQTFPGGDLGIDTDVDPIGITVSRITQTGARILAEIQAMAATDPTFDWDISAGWTGRALQMWVKRGVDRGVVLTYRWRDGRPESSVVSDLSRQLDPADYANWIHVSGSDQLVDVPGTGAPSYYDEWGNYYEAVPPDQAPATTPTWRVVGDIATRPEGRWEQILSFTDIMSQAELEAKADAEAARLDGITPTWTITLKQGAWQGPDHIWLGDPIRLVVQSGRLVEDVTLRVTELDVTLGESGEEGVQLTLGDPRTTLLTRLRDAERRLAVSTRWRPAP